MFDVRVLFEGKFAPRYIEEILRSKLIRDHVRVKLHKAMASGKFILNAYGQQGMYNHHDYDTLVAIGEIIGSDIKDFPVGTEVAVSGVPPATIVDVHKDAVLIKKKEVADYFALFAKVYVTELMNAVEKRNLLKNDPTILVIGSDIFSEFIAQALVEKGLPCGQFLGTALTDDLEFPEDYDIVFDSRIPVCAEVPSVLPIVAGGWYAPVMPGKSYHENLPSSYVNVFGFGINNKHLAHAVSKSTDMDIDLSVVDYRKETCPFGNLFPSILSDKRYVIIEY